MVRFYKLAALAFAAALWCQATPIASISDTIALSDPTMSGRLSRNGVPSDWSSAKAFPGAFNTGVALYYYKTYTFAIDPYSPYLEISVDDPLTAIVVSAYWNTFTPAPGPTALNYLGDNGSSGNVFGGPRYFQVVAPGAGNLVLMVSNSSATAADLGSSFGITVDAFADSNYTETPEPATVALAGGALALLAGLRKFRRAA